MTAAKKRPKRCRHPQLVNMVDRNAHDQVVLWCLGCGALKTGDGPWWYPTRSHYVGVRPEDRVGN